MHPQNIRKNLGLESIRGLAALAVVLWHFVDLLNRPSTPGGLTGWFATGLAWCQSGPFRFMFEGKLAVCIFFVLSGYVLSIGFHKEGRELYGLRSTLRRLPRLAIPVWFAIVISHLLLSNGFYFHEQILSEVSGLNLTRLSNDFTFVPSWKLVLREMTSVFKSAEMANEYNRALWTMSTELAGSLLVFSFQSLFLSASRRWILYLMLIGWNLRFANYFLVDFAIGMALCEWQYRPRKETSPADRRFEKASRYLGAACLVYFLFLRLPLRNLLVPYSLSDSYFILFFEATFVVAAGAFDEGAKKILALRPLVFLGEISFAMYILHLPVFFSVGMWSYLKVYGQTSQHSPALLVSFVASLVSLLFVSTFFTRYIDSATIRISNKIASYFIPEARPSTLQSRPSNFEQRSVA